MYVEFLFLIKLVVLYKSILQTSKNHPNQLHYYRNLDMINLMTYDLHGSWESHTGHQSALFKDHRESGNDTFLNIVSINFREIYKDIEIKRKVQINITAFEIKVKQVSVDYIKRKEYGIYA